MRPTIAAALLLGMSPLVLAVPARAAQDAGALAAELRAMREKIAELEAKVSALESERRIAAAVPAPAAVADATPPPAAAASVPQDDTQVVWRGAPRLVNEDAGFSFKVRGFAQYDAGFVANPRGAIPTNNLGFNSRGRRIVIGADGTLPGGFAYKAEFNFGGGNQDYEDVIITYAPDGSPWLLTVGNFFPLAGLEATTSSRLGSVLEREQATDAFSLQRRIGVALRYTDPEDRFLVEAGLFNAAINSDFANDSWQASARAVYSPRIGEKGRLHVGASIQHRETRSDAQNVRYRSRPLTQITDIRFVDTGAIAARGDRILGLEMVGIHGPFHFAAEGHRSWVDGYRPGAAFDGLEGVGNGVFTSGDPTFQTGYAEIGYYLTGETRAYASGRWNNLKVLRPFDKGGWGALQLNARVDRADLTDRIGESEIIDGGIQTAYQLSAIWNPTDYIRLLLQYSRIQIQGGPWAGTVRPDASSPMSERDYGTDSVALRTQVEF